MSNGDSTRSNMKSLKVGLAQIAPVWLDKEQTKEKIILYVQKAGAEECDLVIFGEALLPGYPFWLGFTGGAAFNDDTQKAIHAHYLREAVDINGGDLSSICDAARDNDIAVHLGTIELGTDRGGHSVYCSMVYIDKTGEIKSVHRKLMPTYEERLVWAIGDGHGLVVHDLEGFKVGGLNCWENWMPLARTALYAQGENIHVAIWPGSVRNTHDITPFIAKESRSYSIGVSSLMRKEDIPPHLPHYELLMASVPDVMADGGSCIAAPDGEWVVPPVEGKEALITGTLFHDMVLMERQNFDPVGHYSRPDVTRLVVNKQRQNILTEEG